MHFFARLALHAARVAAQIVHRKMHAVQFASRRVDVARMFGAAGQHQRVAFAQQFSRRHIGADANAGVKLHALGAQLRQAPLHHALFQFEIGNAVAQQAAGLRLLFIHGDAVAGARQLLRACQTGGARADYGDAPAAALRGNLRRDPAFGEGALGDGVLYGLDGDRLVVQIQSACALARRRADAAGDFRKVVGRMQRLGRGAPVAAPDQVVPVGNDVVHRAGRVAVGNAAVHAARGLLRQFARIRGRDEFFEVANAAAHRRVLPLGAREFQKTGGLTHGAPPRLRRGARPRPARALAARGGNPPA